MPGAGAVGENEVVVSGSMMNSWGRLGEDTYCLVSRFRQ